MKAPHGRPVIGDSCGHPPSLRQVRQFRPHTGIIQAGSHGVGLQDLAVGVLEDFCQGAVQHAVAPQAQAGSVICGPIRASWPPASGLHGYQPDRLIGQEGSEDAHGIAAPAHAGHYAVGQTALCLQDLLFRLLPYHALEVPHHAGKWMGSRCRSQQIMGMIKGRSPVPHGLVYGVLEGPGAGPDRYDLCSHEAHAVDVHLLPLYVHLAHIDLGLEAQIGSHDGRGHPVLARSRLGDKTALAHSLSYQSLAQGVVELMRPAVHQVLPLKVDLASQLAAEVLGLVESGWPPGKIPEQEAQLLPEAFILHQSQIGI